LSRKNIVAYPRTGGVILITDNSPTTTDRYYLQTTDEKFWSTDKIPTNANYRQVCLHNGFVVVTNYAQKGF